jgi:hypothetical protein
VPYCLLRLMSYVRWVPASRLALGKRRWTERISVCFRQIQE